MQALKAGEVVVVAGFQGVDEDDNITTLGRGGSDTSAVALAAFLKCRRPARFTPTSRAFIRPIRASVPTPASSTRISYDEMIELASLGAKVLQIRSVEFAKKYSVPVHVRSTFPTPKAPGWSTRRRV